MAWHGVPVITTLVLAAALLQTQEPPTEWIDRDTGHRVMRLSTQPGSASLYFASVVQGKVRLLFVGRRTSLVYYSRPDRNAGTTRVGSGTIYAAFRSNMHRASQVYAVEVAKAR